MDAQMKRIKGGHQDVWGHDHKIIRAEWKCALAGDHTSFKMRQMATRTDQLIHITNATGSKIYTREAQGSAKALVLSLNSSMLIPTDFTRRGQPGLWWAYKAYTQAMPSGILTCQEVWT